MKDTCAIDRVLQSAVGAVPGVVALVTDRAGTIYEGAFGRRDVSADAPMTIDTVFWLASMTKALTSAAALQLVEQKKLSLEAPIAEVIPELAAPQVLEGFSDAGDPLLRPAAGPITLRHLLTHSAGYGYTGLSRDLGRYFELAELPRSPTNYEELRRTPLLFDPGTRWAYGINTDVAGKATERASGQRLDEYLTEHLLGPMGMHDTTVSLSAEQRGRLARLHMRQPDASLAPTDNAAGSGPAFCMGGGALCGTGRDYLRFTRMVLNNGILDGARVLSPATVAGMSRNHLGTPSVTKLRSVDPAFSHEVEFFPGIDKKWSTAFMINTAHAPTGRNAGGLMWGGVANTFFWIDPTAGIAGVLLMQLLPFADAAVMQIFEAFERAVYAAVTK
jgi:methyl acetate hydrolase